MQSQARRPRRDRHRPLLLRVGLLGSLASAVVLIGLVAFSQAETASGQGGPGRPADVSAGPPLSAPAAPAMAAAVALSQPPLPAPPPADVFEGRIQAGETLSGILRAHGMTPQGVRAIADAMAPHFDFRRARPGHRYRIARDEDGRLLRFDYRISADKAYYLEPVGDGYRVELRDTDLMPRPAMLAGLVSTTVYSAVRALGESGQLANDFAEVFAWDIDFQRGVKPGDAFQIVYERLVRIALDGTETYVRPGRILAARYDGTSGRHSAFYFESGQGRGGYYHPDGTSVEGEFLMAPLRHARITSKYSNARRHPILKITRPHQGVDYAAPVGDPVWAVASGEVIYRARAGGFGNLVKIRHKNGYVSYYAHLSRFSQGLAVGQRVSQKQVIGYVGQTGLATGPHVCFRVRKDGQYVDPTQLRIGQRESIPEALRPGFEATRDLRLAQLDGRRVIAGVAQRR